MMGWIGIAGAIIGFLIVIWQIKVTRPKSKKHRKKWFILSGLLFLGALLVLLNEIKDETEQDKMTLLRATVLEEGLQSSPPTSVEEFKRRFANRGIEPGEALIDSIAIALEALKAQQTDKAIDIYLSLLHRLPEVPELNYNLGTAYLLKRNWNNARKALELAARADTERLEIFNNLGLVYLILKDTLKAKSAYQKALRLVPEDPIALCNLGTLYKALGHFSEAKSIYQRVLASDSNFAAAHFNLGNLYSKTDSFPEAVKHYREAIRINRTDAQAHNNLGCALKSLGRFAESEWAFGESISQDSTSANAYVNLGGLLNDLDGRIDEAKELLEMAVIKDLNSAEAHLNLGICLFKKKLYEKSKVELTKARELFLKRNNKEMVMRIDKNLELPLFH